MALTAPTACHRSPFRLRKQYKIYLLHHSQHPRVGSDPFGTLQYATPALSWQENLPLNINNFFKLKFGANSQ